MDEETYQAYFAICTNSALPEKFSGPSNKKERANLLRQRHKYKVENNKLCYNYGIRKNRKKVEDCWLQVVKKVCILIDCILTKTVRSE